MDKLKDLLKGDWGGIITALLLGIVISAFFPGFIIFIVIAAVGYTVFCLNKKPNGKA